MLVVVDDIIVNLAQLLTVSFKDDKTLYIAYINSDPWEHEFDTVEEAKQAFETLCKYIDFYENTKEYRN